MRKKALTSTGVALVNLKTNEIKWIPLEKDLQILDNTQIIRDDIYDLSNVYTVVGTAQYMKNCYPRTCYECSDLVEECIKEDIEMTMTVNFNPLLKRYKLEKGSHFDNFK